ncbi:MAG: hypothetical protein ABIQ30_05860 [Devosia sp.]
MPDHIIAADLDGLEGLLTKLAQLRANGRISLIHRTMARAASDRLNRLMKIAPDAHHRRISSLSRLYATFMNSLKR